MAMCRLREYFLHLTAFGSLLGCLSNLDEIRCGACPSDFVCQQTQVNQFECIPRNREGMLILDGGRTGAVEQFDSGLLDADGGIFVSSNDPDSILANLDDLLPVEDAALLDDVELQLDQWMDQDMTVDSKRWISSGNQYPSVRITEMNVPTMVPQSAVFGCTVEGFNAGTGLSGIFAILGTTLTDQLTETIEGHIPFVLLSSFRDWRSGQTAAEYGGGRLEFYSGERNTERTFIVDESSFEQRGAEQHAVLGFDTHIDGHRFWSEPSRFVIGPQVLPFPLSVVLDEARLKGRIDVDGSTIALLDTTLVGYITFDSILTMIEHIQQYCDSETHPFCEAAQQFLDGNPYTEPLDGETEQLARRVVFPLMRNMDVRLDDGEVSQCDAWCDGEDCTGCNAVSVCAQLRTESVNLITHP